MLRARDDHVVGQPLGGDPPAVVADERDRAQRRAAAPRPAPRSRCAELPLVESASRHVARAPVGDHLAREDRLGADVVGDRGEDRGVLGQVERRAAAASARPGGRRKSATTSIASVAEPPLPSASSLPPRVEVRAQPGGRLGELVAGSPRASARAARRPPPPSPARSGARRRAPRRGRAPPRPGTDRGSSTRRCRGRAPPRAPRAARGARRRRAPAPRARGRASRPAPGGRTGPRWAARTPTRRRRARRRSSGSRARARAPSAAATSPPSSGPEGDRDVVGLARAARPAARAPPPSPASPIAGSARLPTITGWTNSTATWRTSERAAGDSPNATSRPPRAKRSAIRWHRRASRSASALEEGAIGLGPLGQRLVEPAAQTCQRRRRSLTRGPPRGATPAPASRATRRSPRPCAR